MGTLSAMGTCWKIENWDSLLNKELRKVDNCIFEPACPLGLPGAAGCVYQQHWGGTLLQVCVLCELNHFMFCKVGDHMQVIFLMFYSLFIKESFLMLHAEWFDVARKGQQASSCSHIVLRAISWTVVDSLYTFDKERKTMLPVSAMLAVGRLKGFRSIREVLTAWRIERALLLTLQLSGAPSQLHHLCSECRKWLLKLISP